MRTCVCFMAVGISETTILECLNRVEGLVRVVRGVEEEAFWGTRIRGAVFACQPHGSAQSLTKLQECHQSIIPLVFG